LTTACGFRVTVMSLLVIMASELVIKTTPDDDAVVGRRKIARWRTGQLSRPTPSQVEDIIAAARQRLTWKS
jgi:hypothetical protein